MTSPAEDQLRRVLRENSAFSLFSGVVAAAAFVPLARLFDVPRSAMLVVGVGLALYAPLLWQLARSRNMRRWHGVVPTAGDELWLLASAAIALTGLGGVSAAGRLILVATCVPVAMFASRQWSLARKL